MLTLPAPLDALLFDWDGTLADSVPLVTRATNEVLRAHGFDPVSEAQIHSGMRFPTIERMAFHLGRDLRVDGTAVLAKQLADDFYRTAEAIGHRYVTLFPGVRALLDAVRGAGIPMAIVTNNAGAAVRSLLNHLGLADHFPVLVAEENVARPKPDPAGVRLALEALRARTGGPLNAARVPFVGDSLTDAQAATAAGVIPVGVAWPAASVVHGSANPYELIARRPEELAAALRLRPGAGGGAGAGGEAGAAGGRAGAAGGGSGAAAGRAAAGGGEAGAAAGRAGAGEQATAPRQPKGVRRV